VAVIGTDVNLMGIILFGGGGGVCALIPVAKVRVGAGVVLAEFGGDAQAPIAVPCRGEVIWLEVHCSGAGACPYVERSGGA
jgi:hypothetical protein